MLPNTPRDGGVRCVYVCVYVCAQYGQHRQYPFFTLRPFVVQANFIRILFRLTRVHRGCLLFLLRSPRAYTRFFFEVNKLNFGFTVTKYNDYELYTFRKERERKCVCMCVYAPGYILLYFLRPYINNSAQ